MSIVSRLNETIPTDDSMKPAQSHTEALRHLEQRLRSLHQFMTPQGPTFSTTSNQSSILDTAKLYRTAAPIFLERACWRRLRCAPEVEHLVEAGLTIMQRFKSAQSCGNCSSSHVKRRPMNRGKYHSQPSRLRESLGKPDTFHGPRDRRRLRGNKTISSRLLTFPQLRYHC